MNVLVIKTDQQRFDTLGCTGGTLVATPNIDRLAARGAVFDNAFCCSTLCVPSRVSFFTGQYVHRTRCTGNAAHHHIAEDDHSFVDLLHRRRYTVGLVGKNHAFSEGYLRRYIDDRQEYNHYGKTHGDIRETDRAVTAWMSDPAGPGNRDPHGMLMEGLVEQPLPFAPEQCPTLRIAEDAVGFIRRNRERRFMLHCSFPDPHFPNVTCEPYHSMVDPSAVDLEVPEVDWSTRPFAHYVQSQSSGFDRYTAEQRRRIVAVYLGQVAFIDRAVGVVLDALEELSLAGRTLVVFTSDHGDFAGRFGLVGKTKGFYDPLVRVPLVMSVPGGPVGCRVGANVSNIDVMPTVAEALGLECPDDVQGRSFLPVLQGRTDTHREAVFAEVGSPEPPPPPMPLDEFPAYNRRRQQADGVFWFIEYTTRGRCAMIRTDGWKYCYYTGDTEELYNLEEDPLEQFNLAADPEHSARKERLKNRLMEWVLAEPVR